MQTIVYGPEQQAVGEFDGGKLIEQKPIGFPGEGSKVSRVGPLFYWAWMHAPETGHIALHPHQAFEIMTYVVEGQAEHGDSLGTRSVVGAGGAQVMQTGSGVYHEETLPKGSEGFQIWFEPHLAEAIRRQPTYNQYEHDDFPSVKKDNYTIKTVIGEGAPVSLVTEVRMWDVTVHPGGEYRQPIKHDYSLAVLAIRGGGTVGSAENPGTVTAFRPKDFTVIQPEEANEAVFTAEAGAELRQIMIEVPTRVKYPLYRK